MKFTLLTAIAAGAALVSASPLRVIVVEVAPPAAPVPSFRFGRPVPNRAPDFKIVHVGQPSRPCFGDRLRNKAGDVSTAFRKIFGLPVAHPEPVYLPQVLPHRVVDLHPPVESNFPHSMPSPYLPHPRIHADQRHSGHNSFRQRIRNASFAQRLHIALMTLGRWEGMAVAFVLGCGLGVLLRMIFVLAVVSYRLIRGYKKDDNTEYDEIVFVEEYEAPEEISPPTYTDQVDVKEDQDKLAA